MEYQQVTPHSTSAMIQSVDTQIDQQHLSSASSKSTDVERSMPVAADVSYVSSEQDELIWRQPQQDDDPGTCWMRKDDADELESEWTGCKW